METNKTSDDGKTPITLENLHEVFYPAGVTPRNIRRW